MLEKLSRTGYFSNRDYYWITRCPFCGDSVKHKTGHGHLYIYKSTTFFICFRCGVRGNIKKLFTKYVDVGVLSRKEASECIKHIVSYCDMNKQFSLPTNTSSSYAISLHNSFVIDRQHMSYNDEYQDKLKYLIDRNVLSTTSASDNNLNNLLYKYKVIIYIKNFILSNKRYFGKKYNFIYNNSIIDYLDANYIGFVSKFNTKLILRKIKNDVNNHYSMLNKRYICLSTESIVNRIQQVDFYSCNTLFELFNTNNLIIAEGVFDILNKELDKFSVFRSAPRIALLGKQRFLKLKQIVKKINKHNKLTTLIVLCDDDVVKEVKHLKFVFSNVAKNIFFYKNKFGKDFGEQKVYPVLVSKKIG